MAAQDMPMTLDAFSLKERMALCRRASMAAVRRLKLLGQSADPEDRPLCGFFEKLAHEEERHLADLGRFDDPTDEPSVMQGLDSVIEHFFPSLSEGPGESFIDRESGSYFAECLEEEAARFYRALAEQAPDEESRAFFRHSEDDRKSHMDFVRNVLL